MSALADGRGLNMTVQSYNGNLDFGFIACRELVPDLWLMTELLQESMQELLDLCREPEVPTPAPATTAPPRKAPTTKATAKKATAKKAAAKKSTQRARRTTTN